MRFSPPGMIMIFGLTLQSLSSQIFAASDVVAASP
jgi:hypothetical protein